MRHKCPIENCPFMLPYDLLMCRAHWGKVPKPIQRAVYQAWQMQQRSTEPVDVYRKAREAAIVSVQGEGKQLSLLEMEGGDRNVNQP